MLLLRSTMRVVVSVLALAGCQESTSTSGFVPSHVARVNGRVLRADNTPAAGVNMYVSFPAATGLATTTPTVLTNARGDFDFPVEIMGAPSPRPSVDTVRATVGAVAYAQRRANGEAPTALTTVVLTLVPRGRPAEPVSIGDLRLPQQ